MVLNFVFVFMLFLLLAGLFVTVEYPVFRVFEGDHGQDHDDDKEHPGHGTGIPHLVLVEGRVIDVHRQKVGSELGTPLCDEIRGIELLKCADELHDQIEKDGRA